MYVLVQPHEIFDRTLAYGLRSTDTPQLASQISLEVTAADVMPPPSPRPIRAASQTSFNVRKKENKRKKERKKKEKERKKERGRERKK